MIDQSKVVRVTKTNPPQKEEEEDITVKHVTEINNIKH
jgi:hypothetical protein